MALKDLTYYIYKTQFGEITISSNGEAITGVKLGAAEMSGKLVPTTLTNKCSSEILEYFSGKRKDFTLPTAQDGTDFQKSVWNGLKTIKYGQTTTPKELAEKIGKQSSYKRLTAAAHQNKIAILVPNHRLVPKSNFEKPDTAEKMRFALRKLEEQYSSTENFNRD